MITRAGALSVVAALALVVAGGCAVAGAVVATSAAPGATPLPSGFPRVHSLAPQPAPRPTTVTEEIGAYSVRPLVRGEQLVTEHQMLVYWHRFFSAGSAPSDEVLEEEAAFDAATIRCMADHRYYYDPRIRSSPPGFEGSDAILLLYGTGGRPGVPRTWQNLGCEGRAAHETGYAGLDMVES